VGNYSRSIKVSSYVRLGRTERRSESEKKEWNRGRNGQIAGRGARGTGQAIGKTLSLTQGFFQGILISNLLN
jgi:hypothetical protein